MPESRRWRWAASVDRWASAFDRPLSRRDLLKAGASSALLAMLGGDPRRHGRSPPPSRERRIVRAAIHPAIGIARVGNSPDEYYFGPEIPGGLPIAPDGYKDASGAMKRQAARFRVFGLDAQGQRRPRAHRATTRRSSGPCTSPTRRRPGTSSRPRSTSPRPCRRRGGMPRIQRRARKALMIDPGPRRVSGRNAGAVPFDTGTFLGERVYLGELRTDEAGTPARPRRPGPLVLSERRRAHDLRQQRRLDGRHVRRPGDGARPSRPASSCPSIRPGWWWRRRTTGPRSRPTSARSTT